MSERSTEMQFRKFFTVKVFETLVEEADILVMDACTQDHYEHQIPIDTSQAGARFNITFRHVANHGKGCPLKSSC